MKIISQKSKFDNPIIETCSSFFNHFKMSDILRKCGLIKKCGVLANLVFLFLLGIVFENKSFNTIVRHYDEKLPFGKDVVYRFLERSDVNWEKIVSLTANEVIPEIDKLTSDNRRTALVIDDTTQKRNRSQKSRNACKMLRPR